MKTWKMAILCGIIVAIGIIVEIMGYRAVVEALIISFGLFLISRINGISKEIVNLTTQINGISKEMVNEIRSGNTKITEEIRSGNTKITEEIRSGNERMVEELKEIRKRL